MEGVIAVLNVMARAGVEPREADLRALKVRLSSFCATCPVADTDLCPIMLREQARFVMVEVLADANGLAPEKLLMHAGWSADERDFVREALVAFVTIGLDRTSPVASALAAVVFGEASLAVVSEYLTEIERDQLARLLRSLDQHLPKEE